MQSDEQQNRDVEEQGNPFNPLDPLRQVAGKRVQDEIEKNQGLNAPGSSGQEIGQQNREFGGMDDVSAEREQQALGGVNSTGINQSQQPTGPGPMPGNESRSPYGKAEDTGDYSNIRDGQGWQRDVTDV
ncbi:MAG TPA: hypothetical protein VHD63_20500 [Ktedonobacteraceae bacterium]|nr:hypothetical protein [Ktedonobacteraceae bacterium]